MSNVKKYREEAGLSQIELAVKAGVSPVTISHIENGTGNPNKSSWLAVATALNCTVEELRGDRWTKLKAKNKSK